MEEIDWAANSVGFDMLRVEGFERGVKTAAALRAGLVHSKRALGVWLEMSRGTGGGERVARLGRGSWRVEAATRGDHRGLWRPAVTPVARLQSSSIARVGEATLLAIDSWCMPADSRAE